MSEPKPLLAPLSPENAPARLWKNGTLHAGPIPDADLTLAPDETLEPVAEMIAHLSVIVLQFPKYTDGRAYSQAQRLRREFGFEGELRATGDVLLDQIPLMLRCGFDALEVTDAATQRALEDGRIPGLSRIYQSALSNAPFVRQSRYGDQPRRSA